MRPAPPWRGVQQLDEAVSQQLSRAVAMSESSTLQRLQHVTELHSLSRRLVNYLGHAHEQSQDMQQGIELNSHIIAELAAFVETLPQQIAQEREQVRQLVGEVKSLTTLTDTIHHIARQTEILAINAAIEAARAGPAGKGFSVLAGEVRRLATQANESASTIKRDINRLVNTVEVSYSGEFEARTRHNEAESERLGQLTRQLDDSYVDMRQFYAMLMRAVTQHNSELDQGIGALLDNAQDHDVLKQIIDRVAPAVQSRQDVLKSYAERLRSRGIDTQDIDQRAHALRDQYLADESSHHATAPETPAPDGAPHRAIELF
jgi:methyl-accepting chemotaxis protein